MAWFDGRWFEEGWFSEGYEAGSLLDVHYLGEIEHREYYYTTITFM